MNTLSYGLLALLTANPLTGYELTQGIKPLWRAGHSQIYPLLQSMEEKGFIRHEWIEQSDKPDKKIYTITEEGISVLQEWVRLPAEPAVLRDELHFKLYSLWLTEPDEARALLLQRMEFNRSELQRYNLLIKANEALRDERGETRELKATTFGRYLLLQKRVMAMKSSIEFCEWAIAELERSSPPPAG